MNKKTNIKKILVHVLLIVWMVVIFSFSAQVGDESADLSGGISHLFMTILNQMFRLGWDETRVLEMAGVWGFPIRKLAHMTEFGILAMLMFIVLKDYVQKHQTKKQYCLTWIGAVCYAATDEIHQLFVPGRSGNVIDVCVDAAGITIALILIYLVRRVYGRIRQF